ncbi:MAG: ankyrin repeat domain-containing protein [Sphingobacteriia bacterium]|nr:ankyrin repeat domain-containing protein [Sphingobacteriia bacterium]
MKTLIIFKLLALRKEEAPLLSEEEIKEIIEVIKNEPELLMVSPLEAFREGAYHKIAHESLIYSQNLPLFHTLIDIASEKPKEGFKQETSPYKEIANTILDVLVPFINEKLDTSESREQFLKLFESYDINGLNPLEFAKSKNYNSTEFEKLIEKTNDLTICSNPLLSEYIFNAFFPEDTNNYNDLSSIIEGIKEEETYSIQLAERSYIINNQGLLNNFNFLSAGLNLLSTSEKDTLNYKWFIITNKNYQKEIEDLFKKPQLSKKEKSILRGYLKLNENKKNAANKLIEWVKSGEIKLEENIIEASPTKMFILHFISPYLPEGEIKDKVHNILRNLYIDLDFLLSHIDYNNPDDIDNKFEIFKKLLANGADPNAFIYRRSDLHAKRPLKTLCKNVVHFENAKKYFELLFKYDVNPNIYDLQIYDYTALQLSVIDNKKEMSEFLLANGADVNATDKDLKPPLYYAISAKNLQMVKLLVSKGANVNYKDNEEFSSLHKAISSGDINIINFLLENDADATAQSQFGHTPIGLAINKRNSTAVKLLQSKGADINAPSYFEYTPLELAASRDEEETVKFLLEHGADIKKGKALFYAIKERKEDMVKMLLDYGVDINARDNEGNTPLHCAIEKDIDKIKLFIERGAEVNAKKSLGETPLDIAIKKKDSNLVKLLQSKGADINAPSKQGYTPLEYAATNGYLDKVEFLLEHGADIKKGQPLWWAVQNNQEKVVEILLNHGADVNFVDKNGNTLLHYAADSLDIVKLLLEHGANPVARNNNWQTPWFYIRKCKDGRSEPSDYLWKVSVKHYCLKALKFVSVAAVSYCLFSLCKRPLFKETCQKVISYCLNKGPVQETVNFRRDTAVKNIILHK